MKKILSVLLAVMMLFGALSISSSAATYVSNANDAQDLMGTITSGTTHTEGHVIIIFDLNGCKVSGQPVYDFDLSTFAYPENYAGENGQYYYRIPTNADDLFVGQTIILPDVTAPANSKLIGWYCEGDGQTYTAGAPASFKISLNHISQGTNIIRLKAYTAPATAEEDTMAKVMGILAKVFGAIIGLLFYNGDTEAGVKLMEQILGGLSL